jgi:serine/threonine protein kinase
MEIEKKPPQTPTKSPHPKLSPPYVDQYRIIRKLGKGMAATTYLAMNIDLKPSSDPLAIPDQLQKPENTYVALKIMKPNCPKEDFEAEIGIHKKLQHPNIIQILDWKENRTVVTANGSEMKRSYIVLEYAYRGEFFSYIEKSGPFSHEVCRYFFK